DAAITLTAQRVAPLVGGGCRTLAPLQFSGIRTAFPASDLVGWTVCHSETYNLSSTPLATVTTNCSGTHLMLACRPVGSSTITLAAYAPRADVLFNTGNGATSVHTANGADWYYSTTWSWGFVRQGDTLNRFSCDVDTSGANTERLCWHTGGGNLNGGYRCGTTMGLNGSTAWERLVYQANL
ncbi:MAG TPA: hypothetical protein VFZ61_27930, partial [Polyangiales bacterium]